MSRWRMPIVAAVITLLPLSPIARADVDDDWSQISALLGTIRGVATTPPAGIVTGKYTTGMLLGNGDIGVVAGDTTTSQKFYFGKGDFWGKKKKGNTDQLE